MPVGGLKAKSLKQSAVRAILSAMLQLKDIGNMFWFSVIGSWGLLGGDMGTVFAFLASWN